LLNISFLWLLLKLLIARGYSVGSLSAKLLSGPRLSSVEVHPSLR